MATKPAIRKQNALPVVSVYTLTLNCCECLETTGSYSTDGSDAVNFSKKKAREDGWVLHTDGFSTCVNCKKK